MPTVTTKDGTQIFYKDWGTGQPIVFSHGWPLTADDWDSQMFFFGQRGYRVIAHDRRGHGRSTQTWDGNDMDTYADDLAGLIRSARPSLSQRFAASVARSSIRRSVRPLADRNQKHGQPILWIESRQNRRAG